MAMAAINMVSRGGVSGVSFHLRTCPQGVASVLCMKTPIFGSGQSKLDHLQYWVHSVLIYSYLCLFIPYQVTSSARRLCRRWSTSTGRTSFTEISSPRTCSWTGTATWRSPTLVSRKSSPTGKQTNPPTNIKQALLFKLHTRAARYYLSANGLFAFTLTLENCAADRPWVKVVDSRALFLSLLFLARKLWRSSFYYSSTLNLFQNVDALWNPGVPGTWDHPVERSQQGSWLVGLR